MEPLLRIKDWRRRYENAASRIVRTLTWVAEPNGAQQSDLDISRKKLMKRSGGLAAWGVYELLIKAASRLDPQHDQISIPCRGYLAGDSGPWSVSDLEIMLDVDAEAIQAALDLLTSSAVGLIERLHPETLALLDGDCGPLWATQAEPASAEPGESSSSTTAEAVSPPLDAGSTLIDDAPDSPQSPSMSETDPAHSSYGRAIATGQDRNGHESTGQDKNVEGKFGVKDAAVPASRIPGSAAADRAGGNGRLKDGAPLAPRSLGSAIADRGDNRDLARAVWLIATEGLWGSFKTGGSDKHRRGRIPRDSTQSRRDRTSCENLFDERIWPEEEKKRPALFDWALEQAKNSEDADTPMAWLTDVIKNRYGVKVA